MCRHSCTAEMAQQVSLNLSIPNATYYIFQIDELHPPANARWWLSGLKWRPEVTRDHNLGSGKVEYVNLPLPLTSQSQLYCVAASMFKMDRFECIRFEQSSLTIWPKWFVYQCLWLCQERLLSVSTFWYHCDFEGHWTWSVWGKKNVKELLLSHKDHVLKYISKKTSCAEAVTWDTCIHSCTHRVPSTQPSTHAHTVPSTQPSTHAHTVPSTQPSTHAHIEYHPHSHPLMHTHIPIHSCTHTVPSTQPFIHAHIEYHPHSYPLMHT